MQYELLYLVGERQEANLDKIKTDVETMLTEAGATLVDPEYISKRKFAYEIKHQRRGTYVARRFDLPERDIWEQTEESSQVDPISVLSRKLTLNNDVLRFIFVKTDELPSIESLIEAQQIQQQQRKQEPRRDDRREKKSFSKPRFEKKETAPVKEVAKKEEIAAEPKEETSKENIEQELVTVQKEVEKKEKQQEKDIDKQLEEILNI